MFQSDSIKQTLPRPAGNRACIDFSQDALFGIFGPQKAQIGRLEKIQQKKLAGFFPGPARNRTTARFLKTLYLEFLAPKKLKLDVLRKSNKRNFFPGPARNRTTARFLKTLYLEFLAPKKLKLDVLRKSEPVHPSFNSHSTSWWLPFRFWAQHCDSKKNWQDSAFLGDLI